MRNRAFTLIELLIVVAIIAILAAIAVPNFIEAQTRSKVSRAKADMRSVALAIEAYVVDNNTTPLLLTESDNNNSSFDGPLSYTPAVGTTPSNPPGHRLSTPVAYISSYPVMSFQPGLRSEGLSLRNSDYSYLFIDLQGAMKDMEHDIQPWEHNTNGPTGWGENLGNGHKQLIQIPSPVRFHGQQTVKYTNWVLFSLGPSLVLDIQDEGPGEATYGNAISNPMWLFGDYNHYKQLGTGVYRIYDPTNGTVSLGCIYRISGGMADE